jgi:hypothetical protein
MWLMAGDGVAHVIFLGEHARIICHHQSAIHRALDEFVDNG